jgi:MYXO-CTERM domain-containing protein
MSRVARIVAALALAASAGTAHAYVRSTTADPADPAKGLCLYWGSRNVNYVVNAATASTAPCGDRSAAVAATTAGFTTWSNATRSGQASACTDMVLTNAGSSTSTAVSEDGTNLVVFRSGACSGTSTSVPPTDPCHQTPGACARVYNCWESDNLTIALTTVTYDATTGRIAGADMEMNGWNGLPPGSGRGAYLTCVDPPAATCTRNSYGELNCIAYDVQNIVTHEAGHVIGLDHTCGAYPAPADQTCGHTMDPEMQLGETSKRVLSADDVNGVCTIYPTGASTLTCTSVTPPPDTTTKSGGCSTGAGGSGVLGLLALGLGFRRVRRREP